MLALLATRQWGDIVHVVSHDWPLLLDVDVVSVAFEPAARPDTRLVQGDLGQLAADAIDRLLGDDQDVRLFRELNDDGSLFGSGAGLVRSAALVRMRPSDNLPVGLLALGARGASFHPGQGTELLTVPVSGPGANHRPGARWGQRAAGVRRLTEITAEPGVIKAIAAWKDWLRPRTPRCEKYHRQLRIRS